MRRKINFILLVAAVTIVFISCGKGTADNRLATEPDSPQPGKALRVSYNPSGTSLEKAKEIEMVYFICIPGKNDARSIALKKEDDTWTASITPDKNALAIAFRFTNGKDTDSNNKKGYSLLLCGEDGEPLPGARAAFGEMMLDWWSYIDFIRSRANKTALLANFEEDFTLHPESRKRYLLSYYYLLKDLKNEDGEKIILKDIEKKFSGKDLSEDELFAMYSFCNELGLTDKAQILEEKLFRKNPRHPLFERKKASEFDTLKSFKEQEKFIEDFRQKFPGGEMVNFLQKKLVLNYINVSNDQPDKLDEAKKYLQKNSDIATPQFLNEIALIIFKKQFAVNWAYLFATEAVDAKRKENLSMGKPPYLTLKEWEQESRAELGRYLGTQGITLFHFSKWAGYDFTAVTTLREAIELTDWKDESINENYAYALVTFLQSAKTENLQGISLFVNNAQKQKGLKGRFNNLLEEAWSLAFSDIEKIISSGYATEKTKGLFKTAYVAVKGNDKDFASYLQKLESQAMEKSRQALKSEMLDKPAPNFELFGLEGKKAALLTFKGKTLVIDFWATWCPPCRASFPFLKKLVERYKDDESVKFIFLNTRDYDSTRNERITKFLKDNNYPFYVLLDTELDKTYDDYIIPGLPTKVFIDKNGRIRYLSVGWEGDEEKENKKITLLLELLK